MSCLSLVISRQSFAICSFIYFALPFSSPFCGSISRPSKVFIERDGEHEFVGLWSDVESLNECEALAPEVCMYHALICNFLVATTKIFQIDEA